MVSREKLISLQNEPKGIRNICILAHVDHGKTTLADSLVASNGLISSRLAGKLRYMDSRPDEQERGITMKSSAVALYYYDDEDRKEYLINLIDSPGHVDFSSEVSTAVRLCDGAVIVVDVIEGVQPQTKVVLQQAWSEGIKPVLVLNKIDRLITEVKLTPQNAYLRISQVLEQVNAIIGELFTSTVMEEVGEGGGSNGYSETKEAVEYFDWSAGLEEADDSDLYFCPDSGNVIFASAVDGWAFGLDTFAEIYGKKLGFNSEVLNRTLWGDYFINMKAKRIMKGAQAKSKKPLFVQLILENIWAIYESVQDIEKFEKIVKSLNLKVQARDLRSNDLKHKLSSVLKQWLPISDSLLKMIVKKLPSPLELGALRTEKLMCVRTKRFDTLPLETQDLKEHFLKCSSDPDEPVIIFVSKMFSVLKKYLPKNRMKPLTSQQMAERREMARRKRVEKSKGDQSKAGIVPLTADELEKLQIQLAEENKEKKRREEDLNTTAFVAFARVYSGMVKPGQELYVLSPKHDPAAVLEKLKNGEEIVSENANENQPASIMKTKLGRLYLLLGRDLEEIEKAPAGNIVGIDGLENYILKSATLCSSVCCPPFVEVTQSAVPILRVAVEPAKSSDLKKLVSGLKLLNQADINVQVSLSDKGEHILVTAGEVHLERCLRDLTETYAGIEVNVSEPIVPFRETIVLPPEVDMVNENKTHEVPGKEWIEVQTANGQCTVKLKATPLPKPVTDLLEANSDLLKAMMTNESLSQETVKRKEDFRHQLETYFAEDVDLKDCVDKIWSAGPKNCGPNLLINMIPNLESSSLWKKPSVSLTYDSSFINGFQMAVASGPLCEEPLMGVAFIVSEWKIDGEDDGKSVYGPLSGQIMSTVKEGCRQAFQLKCQRLMVAMYTCDIDVKAEMLGKMYAVLAKRHGKIVQEKMIEGSSTFTVTAHLPVVKSFGFANEIRKQTSGLAMPQLVFSHWEVIDMDPFWVPITEEEILHFGEKADSGNQALTYMNDVRKKKGLAVDEKIVEFAEKQRTISRKK